MKRLWMLMLVVTMPVIAACGSAGSAAPIDAGNDTPTASASASASAIDPSAAASPQTLVINQNIDSRPDGLGDAHVSPATPTPDGCYDRGYAGLIGDPDDKNVKIFLLVEPPDDPADAARAVAETLCVLGGKYVPTGDVRVIKADYTLRQLNDWYAQLRDQIYQVDGLYTTDVSESINRIHLRVLTERGKQNLEERVKESGVPLEAVVIEVRDQIGLDDPPVQTRANVGIELSMEFDPVALSDVVEFTIVLTNLSDRTLEIEHGTPPEIDVVVLTPDGRQVWRHQPSIIVGAGGSSEFEPGGEIRFPVQWAQVDDDHFSVPPGTYVVRGFIRFIHDEERDGSTFGSFENLSTSPSQLQLPAR